MFNQLKYSKFFFGILLFLPLKGIMATQAVEMSSVHKIPISLSGPINPAKILKVQASGGGRVEVLHVKENQQVSKDQLRNEIERFKLGKSTSYQISQYQQDVVEAEQQEILIRIRQENIQIELLTLTGEFDEKYELNQQ